MFLRNAAVRVLSAGSRRTSSSAGIRSSPHLAYSRQPRNVSAAGSFYQKRFNWAGGSPADDAAEDHSMGTDDMESGSGWKRPGNPVQRSVDRNAFPPSNQLYIANLLFDLTEQDLSDNMSRFGPIQRVKILYDGSGLSRGTGFVTFADVESATRAKTDMDGKQWQGRTINVQYARSDPGRQTRTPPVRSPTSTLFIGNLSYEMTDSDVHELLQGVNGVRELRLSADRQTGKLRGFCHVDFEDVQPAQEAFKKLQGRVVFGREVRLDFSDAMSGRRRNVSRGEREANADVYGE